MLASSAHTSAGNMNTTDNNLIIFFIKSVITFKIAIYLQPNIHTAFGAHALRMPVYIGSPASIKNILPRGVGLICT